MGKTVPTYPDDRMVDPTWLAELAQTNDRGLDVEEIEEEYNVIMPTAEALDNAE